MDTSCDSGHSFLQPAYSGTEMVTRRWEHMEGSHVSLGGYNCTFFHKFWPSKNAYKVHVSRFHKHWIVVILKCLSQPFDNQ
jgi:hypothetical protein